MNLTELKTKISQGFDRDGRGTPASKTWGRSRKQDVIFAILKAKAGNKDAIYGDGGL